MGAQDSMLSLSQEITKMEVGYNSLDSLDLSQQIMKNPVRINRKTSVSSYFLSQIIPHHLALCLTDHF